MRRRKMKAAAVAVPMSSVSTVTVPKVYCTFSGTDHRSELGIATLEMGFLG